MPPHTLRLAYVAEFLLALLTTLTFWSEIGGQGHLDLMPWYAKLVFSVGVALAVVMATAAAVSHEKAWNRTTISWLTLMTLMLAGMAAVTYYYHLHENDDQDEETDAPNPVARIEPPIGSNAQPPRACLAPRPAASAAARSAALAKTV
jgi:hypothetical protein